MKKGLLNNRQKNKEKKKIKEKISKSPRANYKTDLAKLFCEHAF